MRDKEVNNFIRLTNIETQSREAALIKTERMTQMTATIPPQTSTQQDSDMLVDACDDENYYSAGVGIIEKAYAKHIQTKDLFKGRLIYLTHRNNITSSINFNWMNFELIPDLIYASTNKVHHSAVTSYFSIDDIFKKSQMAMNRRYKVEKVIDYSKITDDQWKIFTEQLETQN
ncbi:hypothetical protein RhiirC2_789952 [Rhizophagus irregularis]|uniref:Uncharacterized protein n=1 Tax=Rhizophagus irregularis TaxID=588596 RepID=A0A2N1MM74_9GLOM|nr:hypothetical protein RhiirC2_789952 [Rhizophagus irregularis]